MYKKLLYRTAFISSPILALFELSPIFLLTQYPKTYFNFFLTFAAAFIAVFIVWGVNIFIFSTIGSKKTVKKWKLYVFSYIFIVFFSSLILAILIMNSIQREPFTLAYNAVTLLGLNSIILIISNIIILHIKNTQVENELTNFRITTLEAEQQQLIQQLQPHFLFNALSTLKSLIKTDSELAEEYLIKLSDFLRFSISFHKDKIISLTDEMEFTYNYIEMLHIRFADSFFCEVNIPENVKVQYLIPIYALQTLVENAVKHNAFTKEDQLYIKIFLAKDKLIITNNKIPKLSGIKGGLGLKNLNKRYVLFCGEEIKINETPEQFEVTIKLIKKSDLC